jgi:hypothetical protein
MQDDQPTLGWRPKMGERVIVVATKPVCEGDGGAAS